MKIVFLGTPQYAIPSLDRLNQEGLIYLVITQPDRPVGRGHKLTSPIVKDFCVKNNIKYRQTDNINKDKELINELKELKPDLIITAAFGQLIRQEVLDIPQMGIWNVHASLLPRWRGAAPIQYAILSGDKETGVTIMKTELGLDSGSIIHKKSINITEQDTTNTITEKLSYVGAEALFEIISKYPDIIYTKQDESLITLSPKIKKEQGFINWQTDTVKNIKRKLQAFRENIGVSFLQSTSQGDLRVKIIECDFYSILPPSCLESEQKNPGNIIEIQHDKVLISCLDGILVLKQIQPPNKPKMNAASFFRALD